MAFQNSVDIANRALQHCGVPRIDAALGFSENSQRASETSFAYGKLKRAELRRNVWRFATRRTALRPMDVNTLLLSPSLFASTTTYFQGSIVSDENGFLWISKVPNNLGNTPQNSYTWEPYFGPLSVTLYNSNMTYFAGEIVYTAAGDGTNNVYISLLSGNGLDPSLPNQWSSSSTYFQNQVVQGFPAWAVGTTYAAGATVTYTDNNTYASLAAGNVGNIPPTSGTKWALVPTLTLTPASVPGAVGLTPGAQSSPVVEWVSSTVYGIGSFVMFNGSEYVSIVANNTANLPNASGSTSWSVLTGGTSYMSLINLNISNNPANAPALWSSLTTYAINNLVGGSDGIIYKSLAGGNLNHDPTTDAGVHWLNTGVLNPWTTVFTGGGGNQQWLQIGGASFPLGVALSVPDIIYPLGSGPSSQSETRNIYRLPAGFLREAPQDPKAGSTNYLGAPSGLAYNDWEYEGNYIVSRRVDPFIYRFVADVVDVTAFDDMFCEGLAARVAVEVCEILTQSTEKVKMIEEFYNVMMREARLVNGIETGAVEPALDDFITCRA